MASRTSGEDFQRRMSDEAANRLHHLSLRYVGALAELAKGEQLGILPQDYPGLKESRDFIDLILFTRAEINALTKLLVDARVLKTVDIARQFAEEYEWFAQMKARFLGVEVTDHGITFKTPEQ